MDPAPRRPRRAAVRLGAFTSVLVLVALLTLLVVPLSRPDLQDAIAPFGPAAPVVFVVAAALLAMAFVPGPLLSAASGALFGTWLGFGVSVTSSVLTAVLSLMVAERSGRTAAQDLSGPRTLALADLARRRGLFVVVLQRWIPGIPDAPFSYAFGLVGVRRRDVALGTLIGSAPRAFAYTALGDAAVTRNGSLAVIAVVVGAVVSAVGVIVYGVVLARHRRAGGTPAESDRAENIDGI